MSSCFLLGPGHRRRATPAPFRRFLSPRTNHRGPSFPCSYQLPNASSPSSGCVLYWSWNKAQPEVKNLPKPVNPLATNLDETFIVGGSSSYLYLWEASSSGYLYLWEVASGRLMKKWHAHFQAVTCLQFFDDESFLISGAEDGGIKIHFPLQGIWLINECSVK